MKHSTIVVIPVVALIVLLIGIGCSPSLPTTIPRPSITTNQAVSAKLVSETVSEVVVSEPTVQAKQEEITETITAKPAIISVAGGAEDVSALEPPVSGQGGTCISGSIIDVYHQSRSGSDWKITIEKTSPDHQEPFTVLPNSSGYFQYPTTSNTLLEAGTYQVSLSFPEGWRPFTPAAFEVTLNGTGSECAQTRFKMEALAALEVIKLDDGGYMDFRERVGIPEWKITARAVGQDTSLTEVTDGEGKAYFYNLPPGDWIVQEEERVGWQPIAGYPSEQTITLVSPTNPGDWQSVVFINEQVNNGTLVVTKTDISSQPLAGWTMTLSRPDGTQPVQTRITGADGIAVFSDLPLGEWLVTETGQDWWQPATVTEQTVILDEPGVTKSVLFTNESLGCVDGYKINHLEQGLTGWEIKARNSDTGEELSTITDETGYFNFRMSLGTWILSEVQQEGWTAVTAPEFSVQISQPFTCEHVRFKNRTDYACVDVFKKDAYDESGLPGWHITLQPAYGGIAQSGITDGTGWVRFNMLTPGSYTITEMDKPGWVSVGPSATTMALENTGICSVAIFYNQQSNQPVYHHDTSAPPVPQHDNTAPACSQHYTVKRGDTMYNIARRFGVTWEDIQNVNHLQNPRVIHAGLELCIP